MIAIVMILVLVFAGPATWPLACIAVILLGMTDSPSKAPSVSRREKPASSRCLARKTYAGKGFYRLNGETIWREHL